MKFIFCTVLSLTLFFAMTSCGGDTPTTDTPDSNVEAKADEPQGLTCASLGDQFDDLAGKEITIKAVSWGTSGTTTGEIYLNLGDKAQSGMSAAKVVAVFSADKEAEAKSAAKDAEVTIKATVGESKYGSIYLTNPTIL